MAIKLINDDILQDIAEAIQEKDNGSKMTVDQMASRISTLTTENHEMEDGLVTRSLSVYENSRVTIIGYNAFEACDSLISVSFPLVTIIKDGAFWNCTSLTSTSFPQVITIEGYAFHICTSLTSVNFPQATNIGSWAFANCSSLTSVSFPLVTTIGSQAFQECESLISVNFPLTTKIRNYAFNRCSSLISVNFPLVTTIDSQTFQNCFSLTSVNFPQATSIGEMAFQSCRSLISVILGGQQSQSGIIYSRAFASCYHLTDLYLQGSYLYSLSKSTAFTSTPIGGYSASAGKYGSIYVPASLYDQYISATNWAYFSSRFVNV